MYSNAVEAFKANFSKVKILIFEEFVENPERYVAEVFEFIGAPPLEHVNTATNIVKVVNQNQNLSPFFLDEIALLEIPFEIQFLLFLEEPPSKN